jgi:hypothetical protein
MIYAVFNAINLLYYFAVAEFESVIRQKLSEARVISAKNSVPLLPSSTVDGVN